MRCAWFVISPSPSARGRPGGAYSKRTCARERRARFVSAYERSDAGPFSNRATPKVVRPLRASKVVRLGAGLASFPLRPRQIDAVLAEFGWPFDGPATSLGAFFGRRSGIDNLVD